MKNRNLLHFIACLVLGTILVCVNSCRTMVVKHPMVLGPEVVEKVRGLTGGFLHMDSTWFTAKFKNSSEYTITKVTVKIKLTDNETAEETWHQLTLGPPGAVIPPGDTVILSSDVGVNRRGKRFYWEVVEMMGYRD